MKRLVPVLCFVVMALAACTTTSTDGGTTPDTSPPNDLLHDPRAARRAITDIEQRVGASPARVSEIIVYPEYMIVEAQDPNAPDHIDRYTWRDGAIEPPEPVHLSGPQEDTDASLFPSSAVALEHLPRIVLAAEQRLQHARPTGIEAARGSYIDIQRSSSSSLDGRVTIRISIEGPRRSGSVETGSNGEILTAEVS